MSELISALSNPGSMGQAQWLILAIAGFVILGSLYFIWKLFHIFKTVGKSTYTPNIGFSKMGYKYSEGRPKASGSSASMAKPEQKENESEASEAVSETAESKAE